MATTVSEIFNIVGQVIVDSMVFTLTRKGKHPLPESSPLVKSIGYSVNFNERDVKTGKFKSLQLTLSMNDYGEALDKGRQGTEGNTSINTNWSTGKVTGIPIEALIKFIKARGLQSKIKGNKGRFISVNQVAFLLQRSIKRSGITPRNFIFPALADGQKTFEMLIDRDFFNILTKDLIKFYN